LLGGSLSGAVVFHLRLGDHVRHLDATKQDTGASETLEPEHGSGAPLDRAVVLFDDVIQVLRPADQDVDDASALSGLLAQIAPDEPIDTIGGDGVYDKKQCHKVIAGRGATLSIPPREGAKPWSGGAAGASWRNEAIDDIARDGRGEWKKRSGYHRRSLIENTMYQYKTLTENSLSARCIGSQATEVAIRVGIVNRHCHVAETVA
jgi:Transposase DDE domain